MAGIAAGADVIAMAAIWAVVSCNGPILPFRGGRIDAFKAGRSGVPEPQQDLATHTEKFRLQGFNETEMIGLVACGHTLGGARNPDFPDIVPPNADKDLENVKPFDTTHNFDEKIVTEYLDGSTQNPLVVNKNDTVNSDLRVFSSDGNVTISSMRIADAFLQRCSALLTRMIDTVGTGVTLTEEISPIPFKVTNARFRLVKGQLVFNVHIRIMDKLPSRVALTRDVRLFWCDRRGPLGGCLNNQVMTAFNPQVKGDILNPSQFVFSPVSDVLGLGFTGYEFSVPVDFARSVGSFWFEVRDGGSFVLPSQTRVEDNQGKGYWAPDDEVIYMPIGFNLTNNSDIPFANFGETRPYYIVAAIHNSTLPTSARVHLFDNAIDEFSVNATNFMLPLNQTIVLNRNKTMASIGGYNFYGTEVRLHGTPSLDFEVDVMRPTNVSGTDMTGVPVQKHVDFVQAISAEEATINPVHTDFSDFGNTDLDALSNGSLSNNVVAGSAVGGLNWIGKHIGAVLGSVTLASVFSMIM